MRERVELLVGRATRAMWVMTFHAACARMLRADADKLGYTRQFTIYDAADSAPADQEVPRRPRPSTPSASRRARCSRQISDAKNKLRSADDYRELVGSYFEQTVADVYAHYERELHRMNAMDFDDLLFRAVNLLELFQEVRDRYAGRLPLGHGRRVPGHQPRPVPLAPAAHRGAPQPGGGRRRRPVPPRGHAGHAWATGRAKPIEAVAGGRRGACPATAAGDFRPARVTQHVRVASAPMGIEITHRAAAGASSARPSTPTSPATTAPTRRISTSPI